MSAHVSCPVFRCPKTSVSKCTGHRRVCDQYYCQTHSRGTLCDRCQSVKQAEMKSSYRQMLETLERKAYASSITISVIALALVSLLLLAVAIVFTIQQRYKESGPITFIFLLGGGMAGLFGSLFWWVMKAREYMRAESVELDLQYPGFYDYYQERQAKIDEITSGSTY